MKLICIDGYNINPLMHAPVEGQIYTMVGHSTVYKNNIYLAELPTSIDGRRCSYMAKQFLPLNGPDMAERDEAYQREHVAVEGKLFEGVAAILAQEETMPQDVWERNWAAIEERLNSGR